MQVLLHLHFPYWRHFLEHLFCPNHQILPRSQSTNVQSPSHQFDEPKGPVMDSSVRMGSM